MENKLFEFIKNEVLELMPILDFDEITPSSNFKKDLLLDDLDLVDLICSIEDQYLIILSDEAEECKTIEELIQFIIKNYY